MQHASFILSNGDTLYATRVPAGDRPVILVHGWSCHRLHWQPQLARPPRGASLLAIDLPGHGESADTALPEWTISAQADALVDALRQAGISAPLLVGHSMGGAVALEAARQLPAAQGVLLVDTFVFPYGDLDEDTVRKIEAPFHEDFAAAVENLVRRSAGPALSEADCQWLIRDMAAARADAMLPLWSDLLRWSPDAAFSELRCPIHAINSDLVTDAARARCRSRVREWHLAGAGHFLHHEAPDQFNALLGEVLAAMGAQ